MRRSSFTSTIITLCVLFTPGILLAHPDHLGRLDFKSGLTHPFTGLDHVLAMLAIGMWAAQLGGRTRWAIPVSFVGTMVLGGLLRAGGVAIPIAESGVLLSVFVSGLLVLCALKLPLRFGLLLVGFFGICHGYLHAAEMPANSAFVMYAAGFITASSILLLAGTIASHLLNTMHKSNWLRYCGGAIAASSIVLMSGAF